MVSNVLKKLVCLMFVGTILGTVMVGEATTSGGQGTSTLTVVTKANWKKPGSESVTLSNRKVVVKGYKYTLLGKRSCKLKSIILAIK